MIIRFDNAISADRASRFSLPFFVKSDPHPLFRLSSNKGKWRDILRWRERSSRVAGGWLGWLVTTFRHRCRVTWTTTLSLLGSCRVLGHPTKLHFVTPISCVPRSLIPISPILYLSTAWRSIDVYYVYTGYSSRRICPVYPFTFDYIWLYLIICLSIFFAFATTFLALLCSGVHLLLRGMSHIRCVSRNHSHSEIWDSLFFSSLTLENYIKIEKLIWILLFIWK